MLAVEIFTVCFFSQFFMRFPFQLSGNRSTISNSGQPNHTFLKR
jgi:hypothetical protein